MGALDFLRRARTAWELAAKKEQLKDLIALLQPSWERSKLRSLDSANSAGYETLAITEDGMIASPSGFPRGFVRYHEFKRPAPADTPGFIREGVSLALDWLERTPDAPWFLFLHSYVVHGPFTPPPEYDVFRTYRVNGVEVPIGPGTPESVRKRHRYAGEIRYADSQLARLFAALAARGELDRERGFVRKPVQVRKNQPIRSRPPCGSCNRSRYSAANSLSMHASTRSHVAFSSGRSGSAHA